jgi:mRNA interferase RelE/StbE
MGSYRLVFKRSVAKDLRSLPKGDVAKVMARILALAEDPRGPGCEKLSGLDRYRIRQGDYRILYEIQDLIVTVVVVKVAHRKEAYR